jgi:hypothetical protein
VPVKLCVTQPRWLLGKADSRWPSTYGAHFNFGEKGDKFMPSTTNRVLTGHEEIRRWAEERNTKPA